MIFTNQINLYLFHVHDCYSLFHLIFPPFVIDFFCMTMQQTSEMTLDAPDIIDDYCLNLMDWSSSNVLALALENTVYLWDASNGSASELVTVDDEDGPVTSVSWAADGQHIAIGLNSSSV